MCRISLMVYLVWYSSSAFAVNRELLVGVHFQSSYLKANAMHLNGWIFGSSATVCSTSQLQQTAYFWRLIISFSAQIFMTFRGFCFLNSSLKKRTSPRTYCQRLRNSANVVLNTLSTHSAGTTSFWRLQHHQLCASIFDSCSQYM